MEEYAAKHELVYINFLELIEECGLDFTTDTYDAGLHLNLSGAKKASTWFGRFLVENCGITSRRGEEKLESLWEEKLAAYEAEIKRQTEALSAE